MSATAKLYVDELREGRGAIPRNRESLLFHEPWQSRAFGMVLALAEAKHYPYEDFRQSLISTIGTWDRSHEANDPTWNYYEQWLAAFEKLVLGKAIITSEELDRRTKEFQDGSRMETI
jgi:nitrile hydratase accessory protein